MQPLRRLIAEMYRRSIWQVLAIYLVGSWIGYQVILGVGDGVGLPDWVPAFAIILFIIGLPIVLATAFVQEGGPIPRAQPYDVTLIPGFEAQPAPSAPTTGSRIRHVLTWKRALLTGAAAFFVLATTAGGYVGLRGAGVGPFGTLLTRGDINEREPILLASFTAPDSGLSAVVREALRVDLEASTTVRLLTQPETEAALARMQLEANTRVDGRLAMELAERASVRVVLDGDLTAAGSGWIISARLVQAPDGNALASFRETARNSEELIDAVDRLSRAVRRKVGESLTLVRETKPLASVTTSSLEALRLYSTATPLPPAEAIPLLEEAIRLDTTFAMAYRRLAALYGNQRRYQRSAELALAAFRHRDRLSERERLMTVGFYHLSRWDNPQAIAAYNTFIAKWPEDTWALNNLALAHRRQRDYPNAIKYFELAHAQDTARVGDLITLIDLYWQLGDTTGARRKFDEYKRVRPAAVLQHASTEGFWVTAQGDYRRAEEIARARVEQADRPGTTPASRQAAHESLRDVYAGQGRMEEMARAATTISTIGDSRDRPWTAIDNAGRMSVYRRAVGLPTDAADDLVERLLRERWETIPPLDRPYNSVIMYHADRGDSVAIARITEAYLREVPAELAEEPAQSTQAFVWGRTALARGKPAQALDNFRVAMTDCADCYMAMRFMGDAFHALGQQDSAIAHYRRYLDAPFFRRRAFDSVHRALVLERLAIIYDNRGQVDDALRFYGAFIQQWEKADRELQRRVEAARKRVLQLRPGG